LLLGKVHREIHLGGVDGRLSSAESSTNGGRGGRGVPVGAGGNDVLLAEVASTEAKAVAGQRATGRDDGAEVASNATVEAGRMARGVAKITAEGAKARVKLLKYDGLGLHLADLLRDDPLGHLLENEKALLNNFDGLAMADDFRLVLDDSLAGEVANEVIGPVEVVEAREGRETSPVVERVSADSEVLVYGEGLSSNTGSDGSDGGDLEKLGEHFE